MDRYKFRGKVDIEVTNEIEEHVKDGWVYGNLVGSSLIVGDVIDLDDQYFNTEFWISVKAETVGQYTGLKDKNGVEIYEGDILESYNGYIGTVLYDSYMFNVAGYYDRSSDNPSDAFSEGVFTVIGNIHTNKDLLEG